MKPTIEQLRKKIAPLQAEIYRLEKLEANKKNTSLIGKCFKYHNCYSDSERWWMYAIVTRSDGHWPRCVSFQYTSKNESIVRHDELITGLDIGGWLETTKEELVREWKKFQRRISNVSLP